MIMKWKIEKLLTVAVFLTVLAGGMPANTVTAGAAVVDQQTETPASEAAETEAPHVVPSLSAEGNTVYADMEGVWETIDGSFVFDGSNKVVGHGFTQSLMDAVIEQKKMNIPVSNLMDGELAFAGVFSSVSGEGIDYTGHVFYMTFEKVEAPIEVKLMDLHHNVIASVMVDGTTSAPAPTPDQTPTPAPAPAVSEDAVHSGGGFSVAAIAVILGVAAAVALLSVLVRAVRSSKKKQIVETDPEEEKEPSLEEEAKPLMEEEAELLSEEEAKPQPEEEEVKPQPDEEAESQPEKEVKLQSDEEAEPQPEEDTELQPEEEAEPLPDEEAESLPEEKAKSQPEEDPAGKKEDRS